MKCREIDPVTITDSTGKKVIKNGTVYLIKLIRRKHIVI